MSNGIHVDRPICWQIDQLIERASGEGRKIVRIRAAKPFSDNLANELGGVLPFPTGGWPQIVYRSIVIETVDEAIAGWVAYDSNGNIVER